MGPYGGWQRLCKMFLALFMIGVVGAWNLPVPWGWRQEVRDKAATEAAEIIAAQTRIPYGFYVGEPPPGIDDAKAHSWEDWVSPSSIICTPLPCPARVQLDREKEVLFIGMERHEMKCRDLTSMVYMYVPGWYMCMWQFSLPPESLHQAPPLVPRQSLGDSQGISLLPIDPLVAPISLSLMKSSSAAS